MSKSCKILMTEFVAHDVMRFVVEKPENYEFVPGQATDISINFADWNEKKRPFTFTSLNTDLVLEFTIKKYPSHKGVTEKLHQLKPGYELLIGEPFGAIQYKGKGTFIAGGAGITPFVAILRQIKKDNEIEGNRLIFSNKTEKDIILEKEFRDMFSEEDLVLTLTRENKTHKGYENKHVDKEFIRDKIDDFDQYFYICGQKDFVSDIKETLLEFGAEENKIVTEKGFG